mmetsp:Transcript_14295/g.23414  ORF Transcript_14295/g.23414 Transcript_14295/m.23414 type:complete len:585 (-) Transcript_14295:477-2231(-)
MELDKGSQFEFNDFDAAFTDTLTEFIDESDFSFPELSSKFVSSLPPGGHHDDIAHALDSMVTGMGEGFRNSKHEQPSTELNEDFEELQEILTTSCNTDMPLEDLLGLFVGTGSNNNSPQGGESDGSSEDEVLFDEREGCGPVAPSAPSDNCAKPRVNVIATDKPVSTEPVQSGMSGVTTKRKSGKKSKKRRNERLKRQQNAYIQCLQQQVNGLLQKQALLDAANTDYESEPKLQQARTRKTHVQMFLAYRSGGIDDRSCWSEVLDEGFTLTMPSTPFCQVNGQIIGNKRKLYGIDAIIKDTTAVSAFVSTINHRCRQLKPGRSGEVKLTFHVDASDILIVDDKTMCHWKLETKGLIGMGFDSEATVNGMLYCRFTNQHKICNMEMTFDVLSFTRQLTAHGLLDIPLIAAMTSSTPIQDPSSSETAFSVGTAGAGNTPAGSMGTMNPMMNGVMGNPMAPFLTVTPSTSWANLTQMSASPVSKSTKILPAARKPKAPLGPSPKEEIEYSAELTAAQASARGKKRARKRKDGASKQKKLRPSPEMVAGAGGLAAVQQMQQQMAAMYQQMMMGGLPNPVMTAMMGRAT